MRYNDLFTDVVDPQTKSDNLYLYIDPTIIAAAAGAVSTGVGSTAQALERTDEGKVIVQRCGRRAFKFTRRGKREFDECAARVSNEFQSRQVSAANQLRTERENLEETKQGTILKVSLVVGVVVILVVSSIVILRK